jgi:tetratricopeptide (TPR) repeat protein
LRPELLGPGTIKRDPDDVVSLVGSGGILQGNGDIYKAKKRLTRVLKFSETPERIYCAQICLGDIEKQRNERQRYPSYSQALKFYKEGRATASDQLTIYGSANAMWNFYLVYANEAIGDIELKRNHVPAAGKYYQAAHEIMSRLVESQKDNAIWRRGLSINYRKLGDLQLAQNDRKGAIESYRESLGIIESLLANYDGVNPQWQSDRTEALSKLAELRKRGPNLPSSNARWDHSHDKFERNMVP